MELKVASERLRRRSILVVAVVASAWAAWAVAAPATWSGCKFEFGPFRVRTAVDLTIDDHVDLSKIGKVYVRVTSPDQAEYEVPQPAGGWPRQVHTSVFFQNDGPLHLSVTAYDATSTLLAYGENEHQDRLDIVVRDQIPWN